MAVVKCVIKFRAGEGYGWTEIHFRDPGTETPNLQSQLDTLQNQICPKRRVLLGADSAIIGLRVSYPRAGVVASQARKVFLPGQAGESTASQSSSLAIPAFDTTHTRHKTIHLRGFWDAVEFNEAYHPEGGAANDWTGKLNSYTAELVARGYGWPSKDADLSTKGKVTGYVSSNDNIVTFTVVRELGAVLVAGQQMPVSFSRLNKSKSVLNGSILCDVVDATTLRTVHPVAAGSFVSAGRFNIRRPSFTAYSGCEVPSLGERRMGGPLDHYPGRSKAKQRV